ncbi:MAG: 23S rRNA (adenine(1618)-N(6))-methyltransferase RlmF [Bacteroidetes bacterium]|nr:23S rRNA (adenine(1618)-N(6))-methyltransferase RlmF [Bacteroidota bacterium]
MHPKNLHNDAYPIDKLIQAHPPLKEFVFQNSHGIITIDFALNLAVYHLNKALLIYYYDVEEWKLDEGFLCPPIPGRADYLHHIADLLSEETSTDTVKGLDIGVGANCIYPILGASIYRWHMVGSDIHKASVEQATTNYKANPKISNFIDIRHQLDHANIFQGIIEPKEYFHFTMCNPPFHSTKEEATKGSLRKLKNLNEGMHIKEVHLNFGGQANELWCNGGESLFIKRMIKQSVKFKSQVGWFTSLVSKKANLPKIYKQLDKSGAHYKTISMEQGNKQNRFVAWRFN